MNSLEFIKMHVDEWPSNSEQVILCTNGGVVFANSKSPTPTHRIDLSEHFAPDYYDGVVWTREQFEACGSDDASGSIKWEDGAVCYADGEQWFESGHESLVNEFGDSYEYDSIVDLGFDDFQLNEPRIGDYIPKSELETEQKYNDAVEVFGFEFGFKNNTSYSHFTGISNLLIDEDGISFCTSGWHEISRKITYNQLMAIGKLKRMMNERDEGAACRKLAEKVIGMVESLDVWEPTINSIVDVGGCDGVVKAIDGEHCWVLKDTSMYDTYHKDSLKQPTREDIRAVMDATWFTKAAAETLIDKLGMVGYKIVRKGASE